MINVFIDYPVPHATIHRNPNCGFIHRHHKEDFIRREEDISLQTLSSTLQKFDAREIRFGDAESHNSIWLRIDLADEKFEIAVADHILKVLGKSYGPLKDVNHKFHC